MPIREAHSALNLACQEAATWGTDQVVSVNLSPVQFKNTNLLHVVTLALVDTGLPARAITELSSSLMIKTTAEGVETPEQMELLRAEGCSHFQGFLYGRPVPASERLITLRQIDGARPAATK
ncbi:EAL domain-containing protein [Pantoea sp.]|uniref:EAL domain-containing protein n=1 Tax=Pantoea sp. TaxID=69393 RepID=UPI00257A5CE5|nr:EAL domain-containing protein [Pantoea sp.]